MRNFAINNIYIYDRIAKIKKKNTVFNKRVPKFVSTLYKLPLYTSSLNLLHQLQLNYICVFLGVICDKSGATPVKILNR